MRLLVRWSSTRWRSPPRPGCWPASPSLGLLLLVVNVLMLMLMLTGALSQQIGLGFRVDGFARAVGGALIVTVATWLLGLVLSDDR